MGLDYVCRVIVLVRGDPSKDPELRSLTGFEADPEDFRRSLQALDNRPMSRQNYNDIGISGGEWTFEGEQDDYEGPYDDNGDPPNQLTGCTHAVLGLRHRSSERPRWLL